MVEARIWNRCMACQRNVAKADDRRLTTNTAKGGGYAGTKSGMITKLALHPPQSVAGSGNSTIAHLKQQAMQASCWAVHGRNEGC